jgi:hypothetical protein
MRAAIYPVSQNSPGHILSAPALVYRVGAMNNFNLQVCVMVFYS